MSRDGHQPFADGSIDTRTPAVIVGFTLTGLGVVRSLAPLGVNCSVLYNVEADPCLATRYATRKVRVPGIEAEDVLPTLRNLREEFGVPPVLFLTNDETTASISKHREALDDVVRFPLPPDDIVAALLQKDRCRALYADAGLDQPETAVLSPDGEEGHLDAIRYPAILKAFEKPVGYAERFKKAYIVGSPDEARSVFASMRGVINRVIVQEWIEGNDTDILFGLTVMAPGGGCVAAFCGRKINSWPPRIGNTARCAPAPEYEERVIDVTARFFKSVGLVGQGALEFKYSRRDDRLYVIEPTVLRADYQAEIATLNGINLPLAYYMVATGQPVPTMTRTDPVGWAEPVYLSHLGVSRSGPVDGHLLPRFVDAYWRRDDPWPWLKLQQNKVPSVRRVVAKSLALLSRSRRHQGVQGPTN